MEITLKLSLDETNTVLQALGNLPYAQISPLVEKVREQATIQFEASQIQNETNKSKNEKK